MSRSLAPLKTREYVLLLKDWGFTETDPGGNHPMFLSPTGKRFPISTPGKVTMAELRQAARLVGVNSRAFLKGPPKKRPMRRGLDAGPIREEHAARQSPVIAVRQLADAEQVVAGLEQIEHLVEEATQRAKEKQVARVVNDRPIIEQIKQVFIDRPHDPIKVSEILDVVHINYSQMGGPIKRLADAGIITKVDSGTYRLAVSPDEAKTMKGVDKRHPGKHRQMAPAPERAPRNGHATIDVLSFVEANPNKILSIQSVADGTGVAHGTVSHVLRDAASKMPDLKKISRGIYRFEPVETPSFVSDETPVVSTPPTMEPEPTVDAPLPNENPVRWVSSVQVAYESTLWEQMQDLGENRYLLRDDNGGLWIAKMTKVEL